MEYPVRYRKGEKYSVTTGCCPAKVKDGEYTAMKVHELIPSIPTYDIRNHIQTNPYRPTRKPDCDCAQTKFDTVLRNAADNLISEKNRSGSKDCPMTLNRLLGSLTRTHEWCIIKNSASCPSKSTYKNRVLQHQCSNIKGYGERDYDLEHWKTQTFLERNAMHDEADKLLGGTDELNRVYEDTDHHLSIVDVVYERHKQRKDFTGLPDEIEETLCQEKYNILKCREQMEELKSAAELQIWRNCQSGKDTSRDYERRNLCNDVIKRRVQPLKLKSSYIGFNPGVVKFNSSVIVPEQWLHSTREDIDASKTERHMSEKLRSRILECLRSANNEMWMQANVSRGFLMDHIRRLERNRITSQRDLHLANEAISDEEQVLQFIRNGIYGKEIQLKLTTNQANDREQHSGLDSGTDHLLSGLKENARALCVAIKDLQVREKNQLKIIADKKESRDQILADLAANGHDHQLDKQVCLPLRDTVSIDPRGPPRIYNHPGVWLPDQAQ